MLYAVVLFRVKTHKIKNQNITADQYSKQIFWDHKKKSKGM